METSVDGIEECLEELNENTSSKKHFNYSTTTVIDSNSLSGYDVLIIPGGEASDYLEDNNIDSSAIKQFVNEGKGYLGICAGAYAASNRVDGYFEGWGIAPDVTTENVNYEGNLEVTSTSAGTKFFNSSETTIFHDNGPAMYTNNTQSILSTYADNNTGYENYAEMIGESEGSGRVILSGSHPELSPQNPQLLANMILWLSKNMN
jgi:glutamine amidotransferase-like uncharacterized protein